jgi:hypothetical protein
LRKFKDAKKDENPIGIELLLESIEIIENRHDDILSYFFKNEPVEMEKFQGCGTFFKGNEAFSSEIKQFIKKVFSQTQMNTQYLNPLNDFIRHHKPLCIFSTNYDACVEKFCQHNNKDLVDGNLYDALPAAIAIKPNFVNGFYDYRMLINIKTGMNVFVVI